jgi:cytochrome c peroxidase
VTLGQQLFNDKRLSADGTIACANCHVPDKGFVDGKPQADGINQQRGQRNSPTVLNAMFNASQFWDGRAATLEDQAKLPILNPIEMGMKSPEDVVAKVRGLPEYAETFQKVFGRAVTYDDLAAAIAALTHAVRRGCAIRPLYCRRGERDGRRGQARLGPVQRQGALQRLSRRQCGVATVL